MRWKAQIINGSGAKVPAILAWEATMTSETTTTPRGTGGHRAEGSGYGLIVFAAILLFVLGFFNMLYGAAAIANSHVFVANAHYVVANLRFWGWITLIISVLQLVAAAGIWAAASWPAGSAWPCSRSTPST